MKTAPDIHFYLLVTLSLALYLMTTAVQAVPSFARQTGVPCGSCHTVFPELTAFGREFKLSGYTLANMKQIQVNESDDRLRINEVPPLSAMLQVGLTSLNEGVPDQQNNSVELPQAFSLYYAGEISPKMGTFLQVTYSQPDDKFSFDMADIRYANRTTLGGRDLLYGVTLNNAPGMADVWNTASAWTYPYTSSDTAPAPAAEPLVNNFMDVAGLGGYALWDDNWYGLFSIYRSAPLGQGAVPIAGSVNNVAPYGRFAWQGYFSNMSYLEVGTYALYASFTQGISGVGAVGQSDNYTDLGLDASYQLPLENNRLLSMHVIYIHENQTLDSSYAGGLSSNRKNTLKQIRADVNYEFGHQGQISLGYLNTRGSSDSILYRTSTGEVDNSASGSPDSTAFIAGVDYLPWENTKFLLQYTAYTKFNGSSNNYNGAGRSASDNNTLFLNSWFMW